MSSLNDLLAGATQQESGTGVAESGAVVIGSTTAGESTEIKTSAGDTVVTVTDDGGFQLSESQVVRQIVNAINTGDDDNDMKLPTVQAVMTFLAGAVTATIDFKELTSKAAFDTFISDGGFIPTIAFVTDTTPFDYTDNTGHTGTDLTWMFVVCVEEDSVITTSMINNSDISSLTGGEIASIIAATEDVNFVNDSDLSRIRNLPDNTTDALGGKVDSEAGKGLSQNNFTDSQRNKVDNSPSDTASELSTKADNSGQVFTGVVQATTLGTTSSNAAQAIAIGNGGVDDTGESGLGWRVGTSASARAGNYRAQMRMNYDNGRWELRTGNSSNVNNLGVAISVDSGQQVSVNGSPVLTEATGLTTTADSQLIDASLTISNPGTGDGYLELNNSTASADQRAYRLYATSADSLRIETVNNSGVSVNRYTFGHNGDLGLPGNMEVAGYISMFDGGGNEHRFEHGSDGIALRSLSNPADGESIFSIQSSGNSMRLNVPHIGDVTTSNNGIRVGTESDGSNGRVVLEEGNWALIQSAVGYSGTPFPTLSATDIVGWSGREVTFTGVGAVSFTMPTVVTGTPTGSQIKAGETMTLHNFNSGSSVTVNAAAGQKMVNGDSGNVSGTGGSITILAGDSVRMIASDESEVAAVDAICWLVRPFG
ncbi:hypothetical protein NVP1164O_33 [Vibrio phage 1.164.O._10N.261.51.A7]|nr:hypothetical protein NVP1164O_33 [Vibrio phage 1.164.O._10N.261.51.A7]